ncbi:hypothetical protein EK0264_11245 [Epidermidibacterium keratini]|uniref:GIY-YIG nuclease family protein n=1 Tax=Epidermidibacterium keratini TaxID=1891644 RepID=A0A7L4YPH7_9ACTN|nr:hypothetical protein [Epidermidibacterium keratini]QHC00803.1 hypothetical protein EK0264_11245 [Epidermidibacterium keratini]
MSSREPARASGVRRNHLRGFGAAYTKHRLPVTLAYFEEYADIGSAFGREKQVQGWGRVKRRALIEGRYDDLPAAARRRSRPDP